MLNLFQYLSETLKQVQGDDSKDDFINYYWQHTI